ncbi:MAG: glycosyltransferase family 1 protein [Zetaproteobacteria bacterium CG06_land_8_20_14_3_00_59_53]|nr:MAG: glycosyltransferase family 1 protein [Zetaproteobacteria bacterium CG23_combo_of_CG06-09_8_20_14_all_59_86]PIQ64353.1 MAG: glycosyltransferase family 1 protein [Zetaproteobacteria bacterium CG11_big_fil_rev_8_21_14_0_20_59_439]PIU70299.1 MAG: glycosyltransferase family 1 protein [Zetaproteobacteria bacterium CG06_land_8_20_14_3_00_59_53]PIU97358.1 MAG: glycosyltransferase family 1 protein [Zetaproteobacteria bacterium CG03_land_8_20_14_0_80_59_51]PIY45025.1 MAG: glycosyltransferase fami
MWRAGRICCCASPHGVLRVARRKICVVAASEITIRAFLAGHLRALSRRYDVSVVVNAENPDFLAGSGVEVRVIPLAIERRISPLRDLAALFALIRLFRRERFELVHSVTPKAGLLAMLAALFARIPRRVHIFTGQVWATRSGASRLLLKSMDRLLAACATHLLADSGSQRDFLVGQGVVKEGKAKVLAQGSISGVDTVRFHPDNKARACIREALDIVPQDCVFLFLGRLNPDKGVLDLAQAFTRLPEGCHLLFVGPDEAGMQARIEEMAGAHARMHFVAYTDNPQQYMAAADVFCLPSYREGFGSVIIEAAACGIPAIGSHIYGVSDAIEEGRSGLLFPPRDIGALADCMFRLFADVSLRSVMGEYARERASRDFSSARVTQAWLEYYDALL